MFSSILPHCTRKLLPRNNMLLNCNADIQNTLHLKMLDVPSEKWDPAHSCAAGRWGKLAGCSRTFAFSIAIPGQARSAGNAFGICLPKG